MPQVWMWYIRDIADVSVFLSVPSDLRPVRGVTGFRVHPEQAPERDPLLMQTWEQPAQTRIPAHCPVILQEIA